MPSTSDSPRSITASKTLSVALAGGGESTRTLTGTGFGSGPNVILFDRFMGSDGEVLSGQRVADVGAWTNKEADVGYDARLYHDRGRAWFAQRDPTALGANIAAKINMFFDWGGNYSEFRYAHRRWVPTDKWFPAAGAPAQVPTTSSWKPSWLAGSNGGQLTGYGSADGQADIVMDTHAGNGAIGVFGNSTAPRSGVNSGFYTGFSFTAPSFSTWYQSGVESAEGAKDALVDHVYCHDTSNFREVSPDTETFKVNVDVWATMNKAYAGVNFGGWFGNAGDAGNSWHQALPLLADAYLAVGPNSRACVFTGDAATLETCTELYIIAPDTWTDTQVSITPAAHENLTYTHLILADGTLIENVEGV